MDRSRDTLRINIDESWSANEMWQSIKALEDLYNLRLLLQVQYETLEISEELHYFLEKYKVYPPHLRNRLQLSPYIIEQLFYKRKFIDIDQLPSLTKLIYPDEQLTVKKLKYGSKGYKDLAGIGEIVGHVKDFLQFIIDNISNRRLRKIKEDIKQQELISLRIENAAKFARLAKSCGFDDSEIRRIINWVDDKQEIFIPKIDGDKITSVELMSQSENKDSDLS